MHVDDKVEAEEQPAANKPPEPEQHHDKQSDIRGGEGKDCCCAFVRVAFRLK